MAENLRKPWRAILLRDLTASTVLAAGSLGAGLLLNAWRREPLPLAYRPAQARLAATVAALPDGSARPLPAVTAPPRLVGLDEFQALAASGRVPVVDARPAAFYRQGHVPGAINVSRENFAPDYARERGRLTARAGQGVAVYCSEADCQDSGLVADALTKLGLSPVFVYHEGWAEWTRAGLPEEAAP